MLSALFSCPSHAIAKIAAPKQHYVVLTKEQIALNNKAVEAQKAGELDKAQHFIESMILIQETDISWMQLGRLYELQGKCLMAREAYAHVSMAPPTKDVPHATVLEQLIKYQKNYQDSCSATLILECQTDNMTITVDNDKAIPCSNDPIPVTPGAHTIQAKTAYGSTILHVELLARKTLISAVEVVNYEMIAYNSGALHDEMTRQSLDRTSRHYKIAGWTLLGSGLAIAAAGGTLYGITYQELNALPLDKTSDAYHQQHQKKKSRLISGGVLMGIGSASVVTGAVLLIVDAFKHKKLANAYTHNRFMLTPMLSRDLAGIGLNYTF